MSGAEKPRPQAKVIVLSDIHLMDEGDLQRDLGNLDRLNTAIDRINTAYADADLVVFAGDLVDRGRAGPPAYHALQAALERLQVPYTLTIGNHDFRAGFTDVFGAAYSDENGYIQSSHDCGETRVIVLDSVSDKAAPEGFRGGDPAGQLCEARLTWLDRQLAGALGRPVIVILHHPPLQLQISSDVMALQDPEALIERLARHGSVRCVLSGHIHMTTTAWRSGIAFTTLAGGFSTTAEDFGSRLGKLRREGPAQMAVVLSDAKQTVVHFDNYLDAHPMVVRA